MPKTNAAVLLIGLLHVAVVFNASSALYAADTPKTKTETVESKGTGNNYEKAVESARRNAIEHVAGTFLSAEMRVSQETIDIRQYKDRQGNLSLEQAAISENGGRYTGRQKSLLASQYTLDDQSIPVVLIINSSRDKDLSKTDWNWYAVPNKFFAVMER